MFWGNQQFDCWHLQISTCIHKVRLIKIHSENLGINKRWLYFYILIIWKISNFQLHKCKNSYFLDWNFDWKSCFVVFFLDWKNPQFNFSSQNLSIERNFFKWDGKETEILHLLFHRIWKKRISIIVYPLKKNSQEKPDFRHPVWNHQQQPWETPALTQLSWWILLQKSTINCIGLFGLWQKVQEIAKMDTKWWVGTFTPSHRRRPVKIFS